jgi:hypothetical protein
MRASMSGRRPGWVTALPLGGWIALTATQTLYKPDPSVIQQHQRNSTLIRQELVLNNVVISDPEDLDFSQFGSASPYQEELIDRMVQYGLDTSDTLIVMEAHLLGVNFVITMDQDLQRTLIDIDVFTWL